MAGGNSFPGAPLSAWGERRRFRRYRERSHSDQTRFTIYDRRRFREQTAEFYSTQIRINTIILHNKYRIMNLLCKEARQGPIKYGKAALREAREWDHGLLYGITGSQTPE